MKSQPGQSFGDLVEVMNRLLAPDGCPWDREQTLRSLEPYLIEETYEVLEALLRGTPQDHCEELGDLLMQVVFQSALRGAEGAFTIDDVCRGITEKLIRRHPHVFGDGDLETAQEVVTQWEEIKELEKGPGKRVLDSVPVALPAVARAQKVSKRAARVGFDWPDAKACRDKVNEELAELDRAIVSGHPQDIEAELGDLLFSVVNLARKLDVDGEIALRRTTAKFIDRFEHLEDRLNQSGKGWDETTAEELDALWDEAKAAKTM